MFAAPTRTRPARREAPAAPSVGGGGPPPRPRPPAGARHRAPSISPRCRRLPEGGDDRDTHRDSHRGALRRRRKHQSLRVDDRERAGTPAATSSAGGRGGDGLRGTAAGMLEAERGFRRVHPDTPIARLRARSRTSAAPSHRRDAGGDRFPSLELHSEAATKVPRRPGHPRLARQGALRASARLSTGPAQRLSPRKVQTGEGELQVGIPQVREAAEPFVLKLLPEGDEAVAHRAAEGDGDRRVRAWPVDARRGVAVRTSRLGKLSKSTASRICSELTERFEQFKRRDLYDVHLAALFLDAVFLSYSLRGPRRASLSPGLRRGGRKGALAVMLGMRESHEDWLALGRDLIARGLGRRC